MKKIIQEDTKFFINGIFIDVGWDHEDQELYYYINNNEKNRDYNLNKLDKLWKLTRYCKNRLSHENI